MIVRGSLHTGVSNISEFCTNLDVILTLNAQVQTALPQTEMGPSEHSERKRKVEELFGDIADIELEDRDCLDMFCK